MKTSIIAMTLLVVSSTASWSTGVSHVNAQIASNTSEQAPTLPKSQKKATLNSNGVNPVAKSRDRALGN